LETYFLTWATSEVVETLVDEGTFEVMLEEKELYMVDFH